MLKEDGELAVGEQTFKLVTVSLTKNLRRRRRKRPRQASFAESYWHVIMILIAAVGFFVWNKGGINFDRSNSEVALSQRQLGEILQNYQEMRISLDRETAPPGEISRRIQGQVLGRLAAINRRWSDFQPSDGERAQYNAELRLAGALSSHAKNQMAYINTGESKYIEELDRWTEQLEQSVSDLRALPTGAPFPNFVQSPLQLVEREMRQALREYRKLGLALERKEITQKQMGERLRNMLMPKMNAVYSKMGAIAPQNDFERKKVVLQQKLMTALLGQVKAMALVVDSSDPKYIGEMTHWTAEVEKLHRELKNMIGYGRAPASQPPAGTGN